nr:penicillin-binding Tp47 domain C-containing protein [uncultured Blautia sp.]
MANQKLMKKVAPVVLSAAVAMTSMPATAFAAEFSDTEVAVAAEESADTEDVDIDAADAADVDIAEDAEDTDVDVEEETEGTTEDETSSEDLFSAEVNEDEFTAEAGEEQTSGEAYVLMNIPYDDFYKAELKNNDVKVDTFTSATKQKTRSALAKGSYHVNADGSDITGVTFPVKVSDISVLKDKKQIKDDASVSITTTIKGKESTTDYNGKDALFESDSYSYYILSKEPSYYKELTVKEDGSFVFSAIEGKSATPETKQIKAEFKNESKYGDYQLKFDKDEFKSIINTDTDTVYGAVINTTDGTNYGLCHQENIWKGYEIAWSTGYTTEVHGCPIDSEHFKSMIGKTIDSVTYYASNGIYTLDIDNVKIQDKTDEADYKYVYAGLTWAQYWAAEGVYAAGDASSSDAKDRRGETDLGAFDAVTRATTNHGLHRGSFQAVAVIEGSKGSYTVSHWEGRSTVVFTDGKKATYNRGSLTFEDGTTDEMTDYKVTGLKYVPVKVKTSDYEAFKNTYAVVENDGTLTGGFGEVNLQSYSLTADVTAKTNGLKTVTKNEDGTFSFSARANGSDSGIKDTALKTAEGVTYTVKPGNGSYGEFLRVDLTGNYGDLGGAMQAVKWTYYGNDSSYTKALQSYGTKFAADNWMHKSMGIQLGLTESQRCQLPEGYDGTGYWTLTVYALGYADYTIQFQATEENIAKPAGDADSTPLKNIIEEAKALKESDYTPESWAANYESIQNELKECEEMLENIAEQTQYGVNEQIGHLREAIDSLVKITLSVNPTSGTLYVDGTVKITVKTNASGKVTWKSSNTGVATVTNGVVTGKKAGTATITASISGKTATYKVTVKDRGISARVDQVYVGKKATVKVTAYGVSGTAKFKSSNTKVATVNSKGVITGKKAGTTKITVTVGKYKKDLTVKVKKPSFSLVKSSANLKKGKKVTIKVKAAPASKVTYKSSNTKVATVNSKGVVTAKKKGTAKITVKCNGITKTFKVTVK